MRLRDVRIGTQLRLGLGIIVALTVGFIVLASWQTAALFRETEGLYRHPLQVSRAVGDMRTDVVAMDRDMKGLFLTQDEAETEEILRSLDVLRADAERQFEVLRERYLGPDEDVQRAYEAFVRWNAIRAETIRLLREGRREEAAARTEPDGAGGRQAAVLQDDIATIGGFARERADGFYQDALDQHRDLTNQFWAVAAVLLLVTALVSWYLLRTIRRPLADLTSVTTRFAEGDTGARTGYVAGNEFGELAASFNRLAGGVEAQMRLDQSRAHLADVMLGDDELHGFCRALLGALAKQTDSQVAAIYLAGADTSRFELVESLGLAAGVREAFSATDLEGELGAAFASREVCRVADVPADTRFAFAAVSGDIVPRELLTIPVVSDGEVKAIVSLGSVRAYDAAALKLVSVIREVLTARLDGVLAYREIQELVARLERQNRELEAQKRELALQGDELTEQNTELELQKRELDEANRLKSVFLSNMSHELRTPLNSIIALSGVLDRRLSGVIPEEEYGYLEVIERNGRHLLDLINDILDISRIEAGRDELAATRFSLADLIGELMETLRPLTAVNRVQLTVAVPATLPALTTDLAKCRQILQNLMSNAIKFTEDGRVVVSVEQAGDGVLIRVADTGIGIAEDHLDLVFDEFRQADETTSRKYGGTGLGLSIARKYAEMLGGSIEAESVLGEGSTFTVRLPISLEAAGGVEAAPAWAAGVARRPAAPGAGRGHTILLVEDSDPAIVQMRDILEAEGYEVRAAHNGREALDQIETAVPDAMILDLMMPEVDGFEVLRTIRGVDRTAKLPVLILTAKHVTRDELSFLKSNNVRQLIQKGDVSRDGLLSAVEALVNGVPPPAGEAAPPPADAASGPDEPAGDGGGDGRPVVLLVEDDADSRRAARAVLGDAYEVHEAENGLTGVERARELVPDAILMDISMPVMDGIEALRAVRADARLRAVPVLAVTASAMSGDRESILAHGFDAYVSKPIDAQALGAALREVLE